MFDLLKQFGMFKYLKFEKDYVLFGKDKIAFYFIPHLVEEYHQFKKLFGLDYCVAKFLASKFSGKNFVKAHGIPLKKNLVSVVDISCKVLNAFGWGNFRTIKADEKGKFLLLESNRSTFSEELKKRYGPQSTSSDWMLLGLFAGATEYYCKDKIYGVELNCISQKNINKCAYVCGVENKIIEYTEKFSPKQINWVKEVLQKTKEIEKKIETK